MTDNGGDFLHLYWPQMECWTVGREKGEVVEAAICLFADRRRFVLVGPPSRFNTAEICSIKEGDAQRRGRGGFSRGFAVTL